MSAIPRSGRITLRSSAGVSVTTTSCSWCWPSGAAIPPIEVYRVGDRHFVSDGHHRVSIAAATGQQTIDAYVTEILTQQATQPHAPVTASQLAGCPA